jgi:hypothetical protein
VGTCAIEPDSRVLAHAAEHARYPRNTPHSPVVRRRELHLVRQLWVAHHQQLHHHLAVLRAQRGVQLRAPEQRTAPRPDLLRTADALSVFKSVAELMCLLLKRGFGDPSTTQQCPEPIERVKGCLQGGLVRRYPEHAMLRERAFQIAIARNGGASVVMLLVTSWGGRGRRTRAR